MIVENESGGLSLFQATISQMESFVNFTIEADTYIADIILENDSDVTLGFTE